MSKYAGITIGPIFDTIMEASSPAALWFASSIFSDITRRLCEKISEKYGEKAILSPYYSKDIDILDGVGKFHDRIIFQAPEIKAEELKEITDQVKTEIQEDFPSYFRKDRYTVFLNTYLQIHYCIVSSDEIGSGNCILALSPYLDALELMKTFNASDTDNPFAGMFRNDTGGRNAMIKESDLFKRIRDDGNQFKNKNGDIRTIQEIAEGSGYNDLKMSNYFAVVSADGDGMGNYLSRLRSSEEITAFSKACLAYDETAAGMIRRYGGMTIYAGGDDLLFLAPLKWSSDDGAEEKNIFTLCGEINQKFREIIGKETKVKSEIPTISFGISVQYEKFPLYEARANASRLLNDVIKKYKNKRNSMAIELRKHSGQRVILRISNDRQEMFCKFLEAGKGSESDTVGTMRTIEEYRELLKILEEKAQSERQFMDAWKNFYDNEGQKSAEAFSNEIGKLYYQYFIADRENIKNAVEIPDGKANTSVNQLLAILSIRRFAQEKGDEEE